MKIERRSFVVEELRAAGNGKITGHAAVFNSPTKIYSDLTEKIAPGAFARAIREKQDVRALWNHNPDHILGRTKSGTLNLAEDSRGLLVEITPPDTQWAKDLMESIRRGDVSQMSFAFRTIKDSWVHLPNGDIERTLEDVDLHDVSPVTYPAYEDTDCQARSVPDEVLKKAAEIRSAAEPEADPKAGEGAAPTNAEPKWEESQERLDILRKRAELAQY